MIKVRIKGKLLTFTPEEAKEVGGKLLFLGVSAFYTDPEPIKAEPKRKSKRPQ